MVVSPTHIPDQQEIATKVFVKMQMLPPSMYFFRTLWSEDILGPPGKEGVLVRGRISHILHFYLYTGFLSLHLNHDCILESGGRVLKSPITQPVSLSNTL